ncbi:uncharacterized protein DS421_17g588390 [Arachis hypogaea]|nr:uncharacterized protein DS421_17g588390 [Arachis hypogaea]
MPFFHPIPPNFYGPFPEFTQTSPPCTSPSIHMHMPPYPPPFASYIPSTPLTDAIMGKLKSPVDKSTKTIAKKTNVNAGRKKELPCKGLIGKKLYSPKSSPTEILKSFLGKGFLTGYSINHNTLPNLSLRQNDSGIEAPFWLPVVFRPPTGIELDETDIQVATYIFESDKEDEINRHEILARGSKFDANRDSFFNLIPKGWIDEDAMYIEEMLQDDSFYDLEITVRPKVSRFADPKHIETGEQKIGS